MNVTAMLLLEDNPGDRLIRERFRNVAGRSLAVITELSIFKKGSEGKTRNWFSPSEP